MTKLLGGDAAADTVLPEIVIDPAATLNGFAGAVHRATSAAYFEVLAGPDRDMDSQLQIDGELLLHGNYSRTASDLLIDLPNGASAVLQDYFLNDQLPSIASPDGAMLLGKTISLLAGPQSPGQYAQAAATGQNPIGNVALLEGSGTIQRADGTTEPLAQGTPIFEDDVISTGSGSKLSLKFVDGTALSMSADARMIMDELVYDAGRTDNSMVLNLVQGSFVFVTGLVAKTGTVRADTPVATMGIRGTTPTVTIESVTQTTTFGIAPDPDGRVGSYQIVNLQTGQVLGNVNSTSFLYRLASVNGQLQQLAADQLNLGDPSLLQNTYDTFGQPGDPGNQQQQQQDNQQNPDQRGQNENGPQFEEPHTEFANLTIDPLNGGQPVEPLQGALNPLLNNQAPGLPGFQNGLNLPPPPMVPVFDNGPPTIPSLFSVNGSFSLAEDTGTTLGGFTITYPGNLTVAMAAGSTVTLASIEGLTFIVGDGTDDEFMSFTGTPQAIQNALNGAIYTPTPDSNTGSLIIVLSDAGNGQLVGTISVPITITPVEDVPELANPIDDQVVEIGSQVKFDVPADTFYEGDGDPLTLTATLVGGDPLPAWLTFDGVKFFGTPPDGFRESIDIEVTATHGADSVSDQFSFHFGNFGFETGDLANWQGFVGAQGDIVVTEGVVTGAGGLPANLDPSNGTYFAAIRAGTANAAALESFLGANEGELANVTPGTGTVTGGAGMLLDLDLVVGDTITFDWFFDSADYNPFFDTAFFVSPDGALHYLASVGEATTSTNVNTSDSEDWQTVTFTVSGTVTGQFGFGVVNVGDGALSSFLYVDNIQVVPVEAAIAPVAQDDIFFDIPEDAGRSGNTAFTANLFADNGNGADRDPNDLAGNFSVTRVRIDAEDDGFENDDWQDVDPEFGFTQFEYAENPNGGYLAVSANGNITIVPGFDWDFVADGVSQLIGSIQYEITSTTDGLSDTAIATFIVTGENDAPVVNAVTGSVSENGAPILIAPSFTDVDTSDTHNVFVDSNSILGTATVNNNVISYDPGAAFNYLAAGETATETFNYTVIDNHGGTATNTVSVTITGTNDAPVASVGMLTVDEYGTASGSVAFADPDTADTHGFGISGPASGALAFINGAGGYTYNPNGAFDHLAAGETATDTFDVTVTDNHLASSTNTITVTINGANDVPVAVNDVFGIGQTLIVNSTAGNSAAFAGDPLLGGIVSDALENGYISATALGDFNNDGVTDIVTARGDSAATRGATVWLGDGEQFNSAGPALGDGRVQSIAVGDFNGDGNQDLFIANIRRGEALAEETNGADMVFLGNGDGTFNDSGQQLGNFNSEEVVLGDVDNDGDLDALVAASGLGEASRLYLNNGGGGFSLANQPLSTGATRDLAFADVNGDGNLDIVYAELSGLRYQLSDGVGNLTSLVNIFNSPVPVSAVAAGDLDNDGDVDLVFTFSDQNYTDAIYFNDGSGAFTPSTELLEKPGTAYSTDVALHDFDDDGLLDLYIVRGGAIPQPDVIYLNNGDGTFAAPVNMGPAQGVSVAVGVTEKPVLNNESRTLDVLANDDDADTSDTLTITHVGGQAVTDGGPAVTLASGATVALLAGKLVYDATNAFTALAAGNTSVDTFQYSVADGNGGSSNAQVAVTVEGVAPESTVTASNDIFTITEDAGNGAPPLAGNLFANNGNGVDEGSELTLTRVRFDNNGINGLDDDAWQEVNFENGLTIPSNDSRGPVMSFGSNGSLNLAMGNEADLMSAGGSVTFAFQYEVSDGNSTDIGDVSVTVTGNNDAPTFGGFAGDQAPELVLAFGDQVIAGFVDPGAALPGYAILAREGYHTKAMASGDVDGDGDLDLILATTQVEAPIDAKAEVLRVMINDGAGNFEELSNTRLAGADYTNVSLVDLDGIEGLDVFAGASTGGVVWQNDGNGNFGTFTTFGALNAAEAVLADVDKDGDVDVVTSGQNSLFEISFNDGNGNFTAGQVVAGAATQIVVGDLDGDGPNGHGDADIGVIGAAGTFDQYINNGAGQFTLQSQLGIGTGTKDIALADFDGDGTLDLLAVGATGQSRVWFNEQGTGQLTGHVGEEFIDGNVNSVITGDTDGDGDTDFVILRDTYSVLYLNNGTGQFTQSQQLFGSAGPIVAGVIGDFDTTRPDGSVGTIHEMLSNNEMQNVATLRADGTLLFHDPDILDTHTVTFQFVNAIHQGTLQFVDEFGAFNAALEYDTQGLGHGAVSWNFAVSDADLAGLAAGETIVQTYMVAVTDNHGGDGYVQNLKITIHGADDAPQASFSSPVQAAVMNGIAGEHATIANYSQALGPGFAVSFWYNSNGAPVDGGLVSYRLDANNDQGFTIYAADGGRLYVGAESSFRFGIYSGVILPADNDWHNVTVNFIPGFNSTGYVMMVHVDGEWVNNNAVAMGQEDHIIPPNGELVIGELHDYGATGFLANTAYPGAIGEIVIWDDPLSEVQTTVLTNGLPPAEIGTPFLTHLRFEPQSGTFVDVSGNDNHAAATASFAGQSIGFGDVTATVLEDLATLIPGLTVSDAEGDATSILLLAQSGSLSFGNGQGTHPQGASSLYFAGTLAQINGALSTLTYTGAPNQNGLDTISVFLDGETIDPATTINVNVVGSNDAPIAKADFFIIGNDDVLFVPEGVGANDNDVDSVREAWTFEVYDQPDDGTLTFNIATGAFEYDPGDLFSGTDSFSYTLFDGDGGSASAVVSINVLEGVAGPSGNMHALLSGATPPIADFNTDDDMLDISALLDAVFDTEATEEFVSLFANYEEGSYTGATVSVDEDGAGTDHGFEEVASLSFDVPVSQVVLNIVFDNTGETVQVAAA